MAPCWYWLTLCLAALSGFQCYQWSNTLPASAVKYVCTGSTAILPWTISLSPGEDIVDIRWLFRGHSEEVVAMSNHGTFVALPAYQQKASNVPNAGIALRQVTPSDTGNYSVEVTGRNSNGVQFMLHRSAVLQVLDGLMTADGRLHAAQSPVAAFSNSTQQWHTVLTCGTFKYHDPPPFDVEWMSPSGQLLPSTQYSNGQFLLLLDNPVTGGSYTCEVPQASASAACVNNGTREGGANVTVDRLEARLALLEAELKTLREQRAHQQHDSAVLQQQVQALTQQLNQHVADVTLQRVSFHARGVKEFHLQSGSPLVLPTVVNNHGNGYQATTGSFVAPLNGTYCFLASTETYGAQHHAAMFLMVDDVPMDYVYTYHDTHFQAGSVQAVVQLQAGQRVWLKVSAESYFYDTPTAFSGFLVHAD